jgi:hypothetical protein
MALSAFGDELLDDEPAAMPSPAAPQAQAPARALSAFGDELIDDEPDQLPSQSPDRTAGQWVTDIGGSVGRGAYNMFDSLAGLGDIVTGGAATPWLAQHGLDSKQARAVLDAEMSPQARAQRDEVANAKGFLPTMQAMARNPAYAAGQVIESVPTMVAGGVAGKGVGLGARALGLGAPAAGLIGTGAGEGLATAGQQAAQTVQQTGDLTPAQTGMALGSGALTGLLGAAGARIGRSLGVQDIDSLIASPSGVDVAKGLVNRVLTGSGVESLEELSQSAQQQVLSNIAVGKPPLEGIGNAAGQAAVLGGVMGGAAGLRRPNMTTPQPVPMAPQQEQPAQQLGTAVSNVASAGANIERGQQALKEFRDQRSYQPLPKPVEPIPFAGSADIDPLLDNLGVQGEQRTQSLDMLRPAEADIETRRRGVVTQAEQRRLANLIGLQGSTADTFARKIGQAHNAEQIMAMTDHVSGRLKSVLETQQRIASGKASDIDKADFLQQVQELQSTFGDLAGARAESGRSLAAQRKTVNDFRTAQHILETAGGIQGADDLAAAIGKAVQSGGVANASKLIASRKPGLFDYYFRAALLSGVRTHAVNITSNTLTLGNEMIERGIAAGIGGAKRALTGGKSGQTVFAEPLDLLIGMARGTAKAGSAAVDAFKTGESPMLGVGKAESGVGIQARQSPLEKAFSLPYRALGAEDAWFATLNYEGELRALARQNALVEKKLGQLPAGTKVSQRIEQLVQDPTPAMIEQAGAHARTNTFNSKAGTFSQAIMSAKAKAPWLNLIAPFVRTPANIVTFGLKRTPLAGFFKDVRADIRAGGAKQERAIARILWGSSVMIGAGALAQAGYITGAGPDDKDEKRALMATGWRPYSIRTSDGTYHEYNRLDPFAQWLSMASDMATTDYKHKDGADVAVGLLGSLVNGTINKTYLSGLADFSEFLSDPKRNAAWYSSKMASTVAQPFTLLSNIASENDPYARESNSVLDAIKYRLPGLRKDLPEKLDHFGAPVPNRTYPGGPLSIAAPIAQSRQTNDPVRQEAGRLEWAPSEQKDEFTKDKQKHVLTPEQAHERDEITGRLVHRAAASLMRSAAWKSLDDDQRRHELDQAVTRARTAVKVALVPWVVHGKRDALDRLKANVQEGK